MHRADFLSREGQDPERFVAEVVAKVDSDTPHFDVGESDPNVRDLATLALTGRRQALRAAYVARERELGRRRNVELAHRLEPLGAAVDAGLACDVIDLPRPDARDVATSPHPPCLLAPLLERAAG